MVEAIVGFSSREAQFDVHRLCRLVPTPIADHCALCAPGAHYRYENTLETRLLWLTHSPAAGLLSRCARTYRRFSDLPRPARMQTVRVRVRNLVGVVKVQLTVEPFQCVTHSSREGGAAPFEDRPQFSQAFMRGGKARRALFDLHQALEADICKIARVCNKDIEPGARATGRPRRTTALSLQRGAYRRSLRPFALGWWATYPHSDDSLANGMAQR
jgi:hypothetical protein